MNVKVFIPTIGRNSLKQTLEALDIQTFSDFKIYLILKGNITLNSDNIIVIKQKEGYFEEAINIALRNLDDADIALFTDDDAIPSRTWIEEHIEFHEKNPNTAIISGKVIGKKWKNYPNSLFKRFKNTEYMKPYNQEFSEYTAFLTKVGLSVDGDNFGKNEIEKSLAIAGVNMSIKVKPFLNVQIPEFTLRGSYNETMLALHAIKKGYYSMTFSGAEVYHLGEESLSRTTNEKIDKYLCLEKHTLPYAVNFIFPISVTLLEDFISKLEDEIPKRGLFLALKGIKEALHPHNFRELLREELEKI